MPLPLTKKPSVRPPKAKQKGAREDTEENNDGRPDAPEGYDENEDLLNMEIPPAPVQLMDAEGSGGERLMISHIIVDNFKSYFGRQTIGPFHKNFTAIIGPNGSGKSNVIDSLLFVFGYRASKIRSKKLSVLIHSSAGRDNIPSCTVSVHFQKITDISRDEWEVTEGSQFCVARTAFRDNSSRYTLNGKPANLKEISLTLRQSGIDLVHNRFLILQGEVEQISLMKPKAENENEEGMLEYLEDIIGSSRLKLPINKLMFKLDGIQEQRAAQLLRMKYAEKERQGLVEPVKDVIENLRLESAVSLVSNKILCCKKLKLSDKTAEFVVDHEKCMEEETTARAQLQDYSEQNEQLKKDKKKMQTVLDKCQHDMAQIQAELSSHNQLVSKASNDVVRLKKKEKKIGDDVAKQIDQIAKLQDLPEKAEAKIEELKGVLEKAEEEIKENTHLIEQKLGLIEEKTTALRERRKNLDTELSKHSEQEDRINSNLSLAQEELKNLQADEDTQYRVLAELNDQLADVKRNLAARNREYEEAQHALPKLGDESTKLQSECGVLRQQESSLIDQIRELNVEIAQIKQSADEFRSSNRLLQALMKEKSRTLPGVFGRLGDLGAIDEKYDVAISTTCGALENIVVDSVDTAQKCIEFCKRENLGCATYIALDKQQTLISHMRNSPKTPENVPRIFDLIRVADEQVLPAFYFALHDTLVANDIAAATRISYSGNRRWRVISLKGEVVDVSGAMTGGGNSERRGAMGQSVKVDTSRSRNEADNNLARLSEQQKEFESRLKELRQRLAKLDDDYRHKVDEVNRVKKISNNAKVEAKNLEKSVALLEQQCAAQLEKRRRSIVDPLILTNAEKKVKEWRKESDKISEITDGLRLEFIVLKEKLDNIENEVLGTQKAQLRQAEEQKKDAEKNIANEHSSISSNKRNLTKAQQSKADSEKDLAQVLRSIQSAEDDRREAEAKILELQGRESEQREEIQLAEETFKQAMEKSKGLNNEELELQRRIQQLSDSRLSIEAKIKELQLRKGGISKQISKLAFFSLKSIEDLPEEVKGLEQMDKLLRNILYEEHVEEPQECTQTSEADDSLPMDADDEVNDDRRSEVGMEEERAAQPPRRSTLSLLEKLPKYSKEVVRLFDQDALEKQLKKLEERQALQKDKGVNLSILKDYNDKVKRYNSEADIYREISRQRDLHSEFCEELRRLRLQEFMDGYRQISVALKEMYQMITLGGDASLDLVDSLDPFNEGISFGVRPPKKSWKQIVNLSGGEKTLASLAFVFGLHQYRPTPLYVMDEIDAALDFRNVSIISSYILERTKNAQFVVISLRNNMFERGDRIVGIYKVHDCTNNAVLDPKAADEERKKNVKALNAYTKRNLNTSGQSALLDQSPIIGNPLNDDDDDVRDADALKKLSLTPPDETPRISSGAAKRRLFDGTPQTTNRKRSNNESENPYY